MAVLTREQILARKVAGTVETVDIGDGAEVVVRGLTRAEASIAGKHEDQDDVEIYAVAFGMVEPHLTPAEVRAWRENDSSGAVDVVSGVIQRLSGTAPGQGKDATKSVPRGRQRHRA